MWKHRTQNIQKYSFVIWGETRENYVFFPVSLPIPVFPFRLFILSSTYYGFSKAWEISAFAKSQKALWRSQYETEQMFSLVGHNVVQIHAKHKWEEVEIKIKTFNNWKNEVMLPGMWLLTGPNWISYYYQLDYINVEYSFCIPLTC